MTTGTRHKDDGPSLVHPIRDDVALRQESHCGGDDVWHTAIEIRWLAWIGPTVRQLKAHDDAILHWQEERSLVSFCIAPAGPRQNGFVQSGNGRFRDAGLNKHLLLSPTSVCRKEDR